METTTDSEERIIVTAIDEDNPDWPEEGFGSQYSGWKLTYPDGSFEVTITELLSMKGTGLIVDRPWVACFDAILNLDLWWINLISGEVVTLARDEALGGPDCKCDEHENLADIVAENTHSETWRLYEVIDSYDDGTYGAEHIGSRFDDEYQTTDPQAFVVSWQHEDGSVFELTANDDLDIVLPSGRVIATWQPSAYDY